MLALVGAYGLNSVQSGFDPKQQKPRDAARCFGRSLRKECSVIEKIDNVAFCRPGSDRLSRVLRRSTIGAGAFHGRVRNGNGCRCPAMTTRSAKRNMRSWLAWQAMPAGRFCLNSGRRCRPMNTFIRAIRISPAAGRAEPRSAPSAGQQSLRIAVRP
jgi:hypothetical protein